MVDARGLQSQSAAAIDALRRRVVPLRAEARLGDIPGGFLTLHPPSRLEQFASSNKNAACWYVPGRAVTGADIAAALKLFHRDGVPRAFLWFGPGAIENATEQALADVGAQEISGVRYPVLARHTEAMACDADDQRVETRVLRAEERKEFLRAIAAWYSEGGVVAAERMAEQGIAELHGAWIDGKPAAMGALIESGGCGILGWAGTDPERRKRDCQSALIRTRIKSARERGLTWCLSETVTAQMTSTSNMLRAGFEETFAWKVWEWRNTDSSPRG